MNSSTERRHLLVIVASAIGISGVHFALSRRGHALHVVHVVFGALYLLPIIAAGLWLRSRRALGLAVGCAALYVLHSRLSWVGQRYENTNQMAMAAVYVLVSTVTTALVHARERERRHGVDAVLAAQRNAALQAVASLSSALRHRDDDTAEHCGRVAALCGAIGRVLGLAPARQEALSWAARVHDVGKIGVRDDVLLKPAGLNAQERAQIERHPAMAAEMLATIRGAETIAEIVLSHHEAPDGSGYPRGLVGEAIAPEARILHVADIYDSLTSARSYKAPVGLVESLAILDGMVGKVDPGALAALHQVVGSAGEPARARARHSDSADRIAALRNPCRL